MSKTMEDITGQRFGKLVITGFAGYGQSGKQRVSLWNCQCDCGNTCIAPGYLLKSGRRKSCGCIRSVPSQMIGMRFGKLTVTAEDSDNHTTLRKVICRCDCGKEKSVATRDLKSGRITSCGCDKSFPREYRRHRGNAYVEKAELFRQGNFSVVETLEEWVYILTRKVLKNVEKEKTICMYMDTMERHILQYLGKEKLKNITEETIIQWVETLQNTPLQGTQNGCMTEGTLRNTLSILSGCMRDAQKAGLIKRNPCTEPAWALHEKNVWEEKEWLDDGQLNALKPILFNYKDKNGYPLGLGFQMILYTGMTLSEAVALRWKEVDFEKEEFHLQYFVAVKREYGAAEHQSYELEPLTGRKKRTVPAPQFLLKKMKDVQQQYQGEPEEFVLCKSREEPIRIDRMRAALMRRGNICGLGNITPQMLRDTYAIRAVQAGASSDMIAELMGFASSQQVIRRYMPRTILNKKELMKRMFENFQ